MHPLFQQDQPDPPAPDAPKQVNPLACCEDPTSSTHEGEVYCESCDASLVPSAALEHARELYVRLLCQNRQSVADRFANNPYLKQKAQKALEACQRDAREIFDAEIKGHLEETRRKRSQDT